MQITNLNVVNDKLETPQGEITAPTNYYMEITIDPLNVVSVPINLETYQSLNDLAANFSGPETTTVVEAPGRVA